MYNCIARSYTNTSFMPDIHFNDGNCDRKTVEHVHKFIHDYTSEIALHIIDDVTATTV